MTTAVGTVDITAAYVGTTALDKIYVGTTQVWTAGVSGPAVTFRSIGALVASIPGGTLTVAKPAGVVSGDLLLIYCHSDANLTMACTGFAATGVGTYTGYLGATRRGHFLWKIAGGSEPSTYSVTGGGSSYNEAVCLAYMGGVDVGALGSTNGNPNSPALAVVNNNSMEVVVAAFDASSSSGAAPAGWTRRLNGDGSYGAWIADRAANTGTTTSSSFTGIGNTTAGYGLLSIIVSPTVPAPVVPSAPTLSAAPGNTTVILTWIAPSDGGSVITGYLVETSANGTSGWSTVTTTGNVLTYTHTGRTNGTVYYYRVSAINAVGTGPVSNVANATPTAAATAPSAPTLTAATPGNTTVDLAWTTPSSNGGSAITGYLVETSANGTSGWSTVTTTGVVLAYTHTGRTNGTIYYYRVSAINSIGTGTASNVLNATPASGGGGFAKYRTFNGTTDLVTWSLGNLSGVSANPQTLVAVVRVVNSPSDSVMMFTPGYDPVDWYFNNPGAGQEKPAYYDGATNSPGPLWPPSGSTDTYWGLWAIRSVSGSASKWSTSKYNGSSWPTPTHTTSATLGARSYGTSGVITMGGTPAINADIVLIARFNTALTDAQINNMINGVGAIQGTAGLTNLWMLGQTTPADLAGTSTLGTLTGTTLSSGASPFPS